MKMKISSLTTADLNKAWHIEQLSHAYPWSEKVFFSNQGHNYHNLKIEQNDILVGFAITQTIIDEATLFNIVIHPDYQGKGFGKQLLQELINQLAKRRIANLWLEVRVSNQRAINLYHQLGFNEVSIRPNYYPAKQGREDALIMVRYCDIKMV